MEMAEPHKLVISSPSPERIIGAINAVMPQLPPDVRKRFNKIKLSYLQRFGLAGVYERVNNRTVAAILAEFDTSDEAKLIASGEVDGVHYELFEAPGDRSDDRVSDGS